MEKKSNRDKAWISELMKLTYPLRREGVVQDPENSTVEKMLQTYPALGLVSEVRSRLNENKNIKYDIARKTCICAVKYFFNNIF